MHISSYCRQNQFFVHLHHRDTDLLDHRATLGHGELKDGKGSSIVSGGTKSSFWIQHADWLHVQLGFGSIPSHHHHKLTIPGALHSHWVEKIVRVLCFFGVFFLTPTICDCTRGTRIHAHLFCRSNTAARQNSSLVLCIAQKWHLEAHNRSSHPPAPGTCQRALWVEVQLEGSAGAAASAEANLEAELGVCAKAVAAGAGKQQSNPEKEPPRHPIDTWRVPWWQQHTGRQRTQQLHSLPLYLYVTGWAWCCQDSACMSLGVNCGSLAALISWEQPGGDYQQRVCLRKSHYPAGVKDDRAFL